VHRKWVQITVFAVLAIATAVGYAAMNIFARVPGHTFESAGQRLYYTDEGAGEAVVLVHGFAADGHLNWRLPGVVDMLKKDYRVITLDTRAHGKSAKPHEHGQYGMTMVDDIARLMDHLNIEKAHLAGYSMGGFLSLSFAGRYPDRLYSLTQGGSGWYPQNEYPDLLQTVPASLDNGTGLEPIVRFMEPPDSWFLETRIKVINRFLCWVNDEQAMARCFEELITLEGTEEQLRANRIPTLGIMGTKDPLRASAENMASRAGNYHVKWIEGADHMTTLGDPAYSKEFRTALLEHIREHSPAAQHAKAQSSTLPASASSAEAGLRAANNESTL